MPLDALPPELLCDIFGYAMTSSDKSDEAKALRQGFRLICKAITPVVERAYYGSLAVSIDFEERTADRRVDHLANNILESFSLQGSHARSYGRWLRTLDISFEGAWGSTHAPLNACTGILHYCQALRCVTIAVTIKQRGTPGGSLGMTNYLVQILRPLQRCQRLHSLQLSGFYDFGFNETWTGAAALPVSLRHLSLHWDVSTLNVMNLFSGVDPAWRLTLESYNTHPLDHTPKTIQKAILSCSSLTALTVVVDQRNRLPDFSQSLGSHLRTLNIHCVTDDTFEAIDLSSLRQLPMLRDLTISITDSSTHTHLVHLFDDDSAVPALRHLTFNVEKATALTCGILAIECCIALRKEHINALLREMPSMAKCMALYPQTFPPELQTLTFLGCSRSQTRVTDPADRSVAAFDQLKAACRLRQGLVATFDGIQV